MLFYMDGATDKQGEYICDCCGNSFRTEEARDNHINKGCYVEKQDSSNFLM